MKVILTTGLSGPFFSGGSGDVYECDAAEAGRLIAAGFAKPVPVEPERATSDPSDNPAAERRGKKKG